MSLPILFCFVVEGYGSVDAYANSYPEAYKKVEEIVGFSIYGKAMLERKICNNEEHVCNSMC